MRIVLAIALLIITIVIPLGAFTRLSDAGLGCPDWPACYGYLDFRDSMEHVKSMNEASPGALRVAEKTWPEMVHRYFASSLGLFIVILALGAFFKGRKTNNNEENPWGQLPNVLVVLVCFQGLLGMWTVTMKLYPPTVVAHLFGGFITFTVLVLLFLRIFNLEQKQPEVDIAKYKNLAVATVLVLLIQIGLGGWMSANYAALVCSELPVCESGWMQKLDFVSAFSAPYDASVDYEFGVLSHEARTTIHVLHRFFALITTALIVSLAWLVWKKAQHKHTRKLVMLVLALLFLQICLGLSNVVFVLPIAIATAHNGVGALLLAALSYLCSQTFRASQGRAKLD